MIGIALIMWILSLGSPAEPGAARRAAPQAIGPEVCATCHEDLTNAFKANVHAKS